MSSTVIAPGGLEISSSTESAASMLESLTPKTEGKSPRILVDAGEPVKEQPADEVSEAAAKLGKKGGEATAAKKAEQAKELKAKPIPEEKKEPPVVKEAQPAEEEPEERPEDRKEGNPRHDPKARIQQLSREKREAEAATNRERERNDRLEQRLAEIERRSAPTAKETSRPADDDPEPSETDHENYADYIKATGAWSARQEHKRLMSTTRETAQRDYMAHTYAQKIVGTMDGFGKRIAEAADSDPSFLDQTADVRGELVPSWALEPGEKRGPMNVVADEIASAEKAPALLLYFAEHPEDLDRIKKLGTPDDVRVEVRVIARGLDAVTAGASSKPKVSQANPPVRPVTGTPPAAELDLNVDGLDFNTFMSRSKARRG